MTLLALVQSSIAVAVTQPEADTERAPLNRRRARTATLAFMFAFGTACGGRGTGVNAPAELTVPTGPSSTLSTTSTVDVSVIPPVIDEPYLNRVLAALDEVDGQATRLIVANKSFVPEAAEILNSIYGDDRSALQADVWLSALERDPELHSIKPDPGVRRTTVERIIASSPGCVWMAVLRDYSETDVTPRLPRTEYVALEPLDTSNDPKGRNRTAWMITADGFRHDGTEPADPCLG